MVKWCDVLHGAPPLHLHEWQYMQLAREKKNKKNVILQTAQKLKKRVFEKSDFPLYYHKVVGGGGGPPSG